MNYLENRKWLYKQYITEERSFHEIAQEIGTYPNRVRRACIKMGIVPRTKSDAQKVALKNGKVEHPTAGKERPEDVKIRIGNKVSDAWENMSDEERQRRIAISKQKWENMPQAEKDEMLKLANAAVRKTAKEGSKLEKYIANELKDRGYQVVFHVDKMIRNQRLQIDMFIQELATAIEVDGPSHFLPIWGHENLIKNIKSDEEKNGLLLAGGFIILRVKQLAKNVSKTKMRDVVEEIVCKLEGIRKQFPADGERFIEIEVK